MRQAAGTMGGMSEAKIGTGEELVSVICEDQEGHGMTNMLGNANKAHGKANDDKFAFFGESLRLALPLRREEPLTSLCLRAIISVS